MLFCFDDVQSVYKFWCKSLLSAKAVLSPEIVTSYYSWISSECIASRRCFSRRRSQILFCHVILLANVSYLIIVVYICVYIYMVCDLKVHVRVFNCESFQGSNIRPCESFFPEFAFRESWILWITRITISTLYRCIVQCSYNSLRGYDHDIVPWIVLTRFDTAQMQQPSFQKRGFARAKHQGPWCLLFVWIIPCCRLGSADRVFFANVSRKFRESSAKEWAKVKMHFEGSDPVSLAKKMLI